MSERRIFQKAADTIAEYNRDHQGTVAGGTVFLAGAGAAAARIDVAPIAMAVGAFTVVVSSGVDYLNNVVSRYMFREGTKTPLPPGFHDAETTMMSIDEIQATLTASAKESPSAS